MTMVIESADSIKDVEGNLIILEDESSFEMTGSSIRINGQGNILYCEPNVHLENSIIDFSADNSVIYLSSDKNPYRINVTMYNNSSCYFGKDVYFNGPLHIICSEQKNVIVGDRCTLSFGIWIRTADPHLVYSSVTNERLNPSKSVLIGDHVWIGQYALILKGTEIHSGSIIGGGAVLAGKEVPSNTCFAGNPAKCIQSDVFWDGASVHRWTDEKTEKNRVYQKKKRYVYNKYKYKEALLGIDVIDAELKSCKNSDERLKYLKKIAATDDKGKFAKGDTRQQSGKGNVIRKMLHI